MNILICSQQGEMQVEEVSRKLRDQSINYVIFERYRKDHFISYYCDREVKAVIRVGEAEYPIDSRTFPVVWYRPKPIIKGEIPGGLGRIEERFCAQEWRCALHAFDSLLKSSFWINPIHDNQIAANKPYQLKLAKELGMAVPETVITNDANQALTLFKGNRVVYKTLSSFFTENGVIYTNEIFYDQVAKSSDSIAMAPGIFQKYVDKAFELRVTVVGEEIVVVKINSQATDEGRIDWRKCASTDQFESGELTYATTQKLLQFHQRLGLVYAAYDFIVDTAGNEIFIECNPTGQWLWLENALKLNISDLMINEMLSGMTTIN